MNNKKLIESLKSIEVWADLIKENSCKARLHLESINSPAPSGGKKKLSQGQINTIIEKRRKARVRNKK